MKHVRNIFEFHRVREGGLILVFDDLNQALGFAFKCSTEDTKFPYYLRHVKGVDGKKERIYLLTSGRVNVQTFTLGNQSSLFGLHHFYYLKPDDILKLISKYSTVLNVLSILIHRESEEIEISNTVVTLPNFRNASYAVLSSYLLSLVKKFEEVERTVISKSAGLSRLIHQMKDSQD